MLGIMRLSEHVLEIVSLMLRPISDAYGAISDSVRLAGARWITPARAATMPSNPSPHPTHATRFPLTSSGVATIIFDTATAEAQRTCSYVDLFNISAALVHAQHIPAVHSLVGPYRPVRVPLLLLSINNIVVHDFIYVKWPAAVRLLHGAEFKQTS